MEMFRSSKLRLSEKGRTSDGTRRQDAKAGHDITMIVKLVPRAKLGFGTSEHPSSLAMQPILGACSYPNNIIRAGHHSSCFECQDFYAAVATIKKSCDFEDANVGNLSPDPERQVSLRESPIAVFVAPVLLRSIEHHTRFLSKMTTVDNDSSRPLLQSQSGETQSESTYKTFSSWLNPAKKYATGSRKTTQRFLTSKAGHYFVLILVSLDVSAIIAGEWTTGL